MNRPYHYDGVMPVEMEPESPLVQELSRGYIERSPDGAEHLELAFSKSFAMFGTEPTLTTADLAHTARPVLVVVGDDDFVTLPHTVSLYEALPQGQLAVVPGESHALPVEQPHVLTGLILKFLAATEPPRTLFPIRRARQTSALAAGRWLRPPGPMTNELCPKVKSLSTLFRSGPG